MHDALITLKFNVRFSHVVLGIITEIGVRSEI